MSRTETLRTARLALVPLNAAHAAEMVGVLSDPALYTFTGGDPPVRSTLEEQYRFQSAGCPRADEVWHNWIINLDGVAIGHVQATVTGEIADLAWVVGTSWQGAGYATEAAAAMRDWLAGQGVRGSSAHIHSDHSASQAVATRLGLLPADLRDADGEIIWT